MQILLLLVNIVFRYVCKFLKNLDLKHGTQWVGAMFQQPSLEDSKIVRSSDMYTMLYKHHVQRVLMNDQHQSGLVLCRDYKENHESCVM